MQIRVAAYAVITDDAGRVLLAHWNAGKRSAWTMPGGGIEDGEPPIVAARREVAEETGYDVTVGSVLGVDSIVIPIVDRLDGAREELQGIRIVYAAQVVEGELRNEVGGSTDRAGWFTLDEVASLTRVELVDIALGFAGLIPSPEN